MQAERTINSIKSISGNFRHFYKLLHKSKDTENRKAQTAFLNQLQFQTMSDDEKIA